MYKKERYTVATHNWCCGHAHRFLGRAKDCYDKMTDRQLAIPKHLRGEWVEPVIFATMHSVKPGHIDKHQLYLP